MGQTLMVDNGGRQVRDMLMAFERLPSSIEKSLSLCVFLLLISVTAFVSKTEAIFSLSISTLSISLVIFPGIIIKRKEFYNFKNFGTHDEFSNH